MPSNVVIRQAIFDWQQDPPTVTLNVLKQSAEGDLSGDMITVVAQALCDQVKAAILTKAAAKFGTRPVAMPVVLPADPS